MENQTPPQPIVLQVDKTIVDSFGKDGCMLISQSSVNALISLAKVSGGKDSEIILNQMRFLSYPVSLSPAPNAKSEKPTKRKEEFEEVPEQE